MQQNIYVKFLAGKTEAQLAAIAICETDPPDMRLAAIQELKNRQSEQAFPEALEKRLMLLYENKKLQSQEELKYLVTDEREIPGAIRRAVYILASTIFFHILFFILMKNTFYVSLLRNPVYLTGFIVRSGIITLVSIFLMLGKQWPRIIALILFLIGLASVIYVYHTFILSGSNWSAFGVFFTGYIVLQLVLGILSLALLFSPEVSRWYKGETRQADPLILDQL